MAAKQPPIVQPGPPVASPVQIAVNPIQILPVTPGHNIVALFFHTEATARHYPGAQAGDPYTRPVVFWALADVIVIEKDQHTPGGRLTRGFVALDYAADVPDSLPLNVQAGLQAAEAVEEFCGYATMGLTEEAARAMVLRRQAQLAARAEAQRQGKIVVPQRMVAADGGLLH